MDTRVVRRAQTPARRGVQLDRPQPLPDFRQIRDVLCAGCGDEGERDGVGLSSPESATIQFVQTALS